MLAIVVAMMLANPGVAQAKPEAAERAADDRDKVVCKRFVETGSLVSAKKICKPKWEWERDREEARQVSTSLSCRAAGNGAC